MHATSDLVLLYKKRTDIRIYRNGWYIHVCTPQCVYEELIVCVGSKARTGHNRTEAPLEDSLCLA